MAEVPMREALVVSVTMAMLMAFCTYLGSSEDW